MNARKSDEAALDATSKRRGMRIGGRLLLLLAVPLIGLLSLTGLGVYTGAQNLGAASELQQRTDVALATFALVDELQAQRSALIESGGVNPESIERAKVQRDIIDNARSTMDPTVARKAQTALAMVDGAEGVAELGLSDNAALSSISPAIDNVLSLGAALIDPNGATDAGPSLVAQNLARARAAAGEEYDRLRVRSHAGEMGAEDFQTLIALASAQRSYLGLAASSAPDEMAIRIERAIHGITGADAVRRSTFKTGSSTGFTEWETGIRDRGDELGDLQSEAEGLVTAEVDNLAASSRRLLVGAASAAALTLIITILLLRRALSSIARPLEELAHQAERIATVDLPEAVKAQQDDPEAARSLPKLKVGGAVEVAEVADAFNDVQDTALRLAGEQAVLRVNQAQALTNLGRRNQTLLARQLNYLSTLERDETDPVFLEHLFKLDHLASRMRRNAESLLILAGSETPRIRRKPAKMTDVIRAAMSEVEDFDRVRIGNLRDDTLVGPVVIDVIHMLSELIENALSFSPPGSEVIIEGGPLNQGGYHFAIVDQGVGMVDVEFIAANKRLSGKDEVNGMPTRYLGQYVVAKLAVKTGAMVRLQPGINGRGVTALVSLPASAMVDSQQRPTAQAPRPGSRESRNSGTVPYAPGAAVPLTEEPAVTRAPAVPDLRDTARGVALHASGVEHDNVDADPVDSEVPETERIEPESTDVVNATFDSNWDDWSTGVPELAEASETPEAPVVESPDGVSDDEVNRVFGVRRRKKAVAAQPELAAPSDLARPSEPVAPTERTVVPHGSDTSDETVPPSGGSVTRAPLRSDALPPSPVVSSNNDDSNQQQEVVAETVVEQPEPVPAQVAERMLPPAYVAEPVNSEDLAESEHQSRPATPAPSNALGGASLQRRVPGASLASRNKGPAESSEVVPERSAEQVRSRLASFQAGRRRGSGGPEEAGSSATNDNPSIDSATTSSAVAVDDAQDWRSTP